jgi:hypothetical protein
MLSRIFRLAVESPAPCLSSTLQVSSSSGWLSLW